MHSEMQIQAMPPGAAPPVQQRSAALRLLSGLERTLFWAEQSLLVLLIGVLVGFSFFQVVLLNLANLGSQWAARTSIGLGWGDSFLRHLVLVIAFVGASLATREGRHLSIDAVSKLLPPRPRVLLKAALDLVSAVICGLLARAAYGLVLFDSESIAFRVGTHEVPRWPFYVCIAAGFALIGARFVVRGAQDFWHGWTGNLEPEVPPL
jgi:TRAP-type C4-dicarboxylate transport system permease small subunit